MWCKSEAIDVTGGPSGGAWGINLQSPEPLKHQPWYGHWSRPHWSILPSDKGANLWGQASAKTLHSFSFLSHQTTTSSPNTFFAWGTLLSKSHTGINGYHCENQSNFSSCELVSSSLSGGSVASVETCDDGDKVVKILYGFDEKDDKVDRELNWKLKNLGLVKWVLLYSSLNVALQKGETEESLRASMAACSTVLNTN